MTSLMIPFIVFTLSVFLFLPNNEAKRYNFVTIPSCYNVDKKRAHPPTQRWVPVYPAFRIPGKDIVSPFMAKVKVTYDAIFHQSRTELGSNKTSILLFNSDEVKRRFEKPYNFSTTRLIFPGDYTFKFGLHMIKISMEARNKEDESYVKDLHRNCFFDIKPSKSPTVSIIGLHERSLSEKSRDVALEAIIKIELKDAPKDYLDLNKDCIYEWKCTQNPPKEPNFCKNWTQRGRKAIFPKNNVLSGLEFTFTVSGALDHYPNEKAYDHVKITVKTNGSMDLDINCLKNCPPYGLRPDAGKKTLFKAVCITICEAIDETKYIWDMKYNNTEGNWTAYTNDELKQITEMGAEPRGTTLVLLRSHVKYFEMRHRLTVSIMDNYNRNGTTYFDLDYPEPAKIVCTVTPDKGVSMKTNFSLQCELNKKVDPKIGNEIRFLKDDPETKNKVLLFTDRLPATNRTFMLAPSNETDKYYVTFSSPMYGETKIWPLGNLSESTQEPIPQRLIVLPFYGNETNPVKISSSIHENYDTHRTDINATNPVMRERSLNAISSLVENLKSLNKTDPVLNSAIEKLQVKFFTDVNSATTLNTADIFKILNTVDKAVKLYEPEEVKPEMFDLTQKLCEKISVSKLKLVQQRSHPHDDEDDVAAISKMVSSCTTMNSKPNFQVTKLLQANVTTVEPTITEKTAIEENYEDYKDFQDKYFDHLNIYESGTKRMVKTSLVSAKTIALTMSSGEKMKIMDFNQTQILVAKDTGKKLFSVVYESADVVLILSADWKYSDHHFDLLMTTWSKDIVWYNINKTKLNSNIVKVEFWHSSCHDPVLIFKDPFSLFFKVKSVVHSPVEIEVGRDLTVKRIYLDSQQQLRIMFKELGAEDVIKLLLLINKYPSKQNNDYDDEFTISQNESMINYVNSNTIPLYLYLSFETKQPKNIEIEFSTSYCLTYLFDDYQWILANESCRVGDTIEDEYVNCECHMNFTFLAVVVHPIDVLNISEILPDFQLELACNPIIPFTVFILTTIYSVILCMYFMKRKENIYFLTDNKINDNYVYFVIVQTGTSAGSGTSSNIIVKLIGEEGATEPHLLNYPDPQMKMLQKGNRDCYVLTTNKSLGDIKQLEIWFDSIGFEPSWNCQDVWVYDFKKGNEWLFKVNKKLDVLKDVVLLTVEREKRVKNVKLCSCQFQICDYTHGWTVSKTDDNLSFVRKVSILFSNWLMTMLIAMFLYGLPLFELCDVLDENTSFYYQFNTFLYGLIAGGISFGIHFGIAWSLRIINRSKAKWLEAFTSFFEWSIVVIIVISFGFLLTFGPFVPYYRSLYVLASTATGLLISGVLFENVLILVRTLLFKTQWKYNIKDKYTLLLSAIKEQRAFLYQTFGANLLRPYFSHLYKPMDRHEIKEKKMIVLKQRDYLDDFKDIFWFGIYILLLFGVILINQSSLSVTSNVELRDLLEGTMTRTYRFSDLHSAQNVYEYLENTLIPVLQSSNWYGNFVHTDPGLTSDVNNKYLGIVRLRQHRMPKNLCKVPKLMAYTNMTCSPEFDFIYAESRKFAPKWSLFSNEYRYYRLNEMFHYFDVQKTETLSTFGSFATYPGGGYVSFLGRSMQNSIANLQEIMKKGWIDDQTRGLFIEFLLYSTNHNQFNAVTMLLEQSATGYVDKQVMVQTVTMLYTAGQMATIKVVLFGIFLTWVGMLFVKKSAGIVERLKTFFKDLWNYVDFFIIAVSVLCIVTTVIRTNLIEKYLQQLERAKHNEFINYFIMFYLGDFVMVFAAVLVSVATIRFWRFLRFGMIFRMMERTLVLACAGLCTNSIVLMLMIISYGLSGSLLFGDSFIHFKSEGEAFHTLMLAIMFPKRIKYNNFIAVTKISYVFFGFFLLTIICTKYVFITTLMESYRRAQRQFADRIDMYTLKTYLYERFRYIRKRLKYDWKRLRAGATKKKKVQDVVTLKSGEIRYERSISIHSDKMELMKNLIKCLMLNSKEKKTMINKNKKMKKTTFKQMFRVAWHFFDKMIKANLKLTSDKVDIDTIKNEKFYMGHLGRDKMTFVDERRILLMKSITESIFKRKRKSPVQERVSMKMNENLLNCMSIITQNNIILKKTDLRISSIVEKLATETTKIDGILK